MIDTGLDPLTAPRGQWVVPSGRRQWDDGGNALSLGRGLAICDERSVETNARLTAAGIQVIPVPPASWAAGAGGPRCMSCAVTRDPAAEPPSPPESRTPPAQVTRPDLAPFPRPAPR